MKFKKGDKILVIAGKDKGRDGTIDRIYPKQGKALISGINMYKKHVRKSEELPKGGVVDLPRPINVSKIMLMSKSGKKPTRIGYVIEGSKKFRVEKKTGERIK